MGTFLGDCRDFMMNKPDGFYDMTFTSPPFKDEDVTEEYWPWYEERFKEILRVTAKVAVVIHSATKINEHIRRFPPKRTMVWGKGISQYSWRWNPIYVYQISDNYKVNKFIWSDAFGVEAVTGKWKVHKYQDPDLLYETIIKMFKGCQTVFDPFAGSGTTERVCGKLGLEFSGCEISEERIAAAEAYMKKLVPEAYA